MMVSTSLRLKERFLGTIFGQAVGDALGLSTEFMSKQEVDRFYPNGIEDYSQIVQDDHRRRWQRGDRTDDTDMMLCILDSFVACLKVDILDIARRFKEWMMNGKMVFSMLLCSMTRCRNSTQCIDKNVSLSVVCKSPANGGRFTRIALKSFENYSPNSFSIFFMTSVLMVENSDLS